VVAMRAAVVALLRGGVWNIATKRGEHHAKREGRK